LVLLAAWALSVIGLAAGCASASPRPVSDHFDGERFYGERSGHSFRDMIRWLWEMKTVDWPNWIDDPPQPKPPARLDGERLRVTFVNHATVLIQLGAVNLLTDPIWSKVAGPNAWLGSPRIRAPGVALADLPPIDVVLISHDHYDHLDLPTLHELAARFRPTIVAGLGVGAFLARAGFDRVEELDWRESRTLCGLRIEFVPAQHSSGRGPFAENITLWGGFVIASAGRRVYFAGDTADGRFLERIAQERGPFDLTILPLGNYEKRWFMRNQHMNPDDAVRAHLTLRSRQSVGMHHATFREHPEQAVDAHERDLAAALERRHVPAAQFVVLPFGGGLELPPEGAVRPADAPAP
jgi:L-ascorbate metabolism protein UlaG (beta-lactamase superfamily)